MARIVDLRKGKSSVRPAPRTRMPRHEPERETRRKPLRVRRREKRMVFAGLCLVFVAALAYAVHWLSYLPSYTIQRIEVTGVSTLDPRAIEAQVRDALGTDGGYISARNLFWYDARAIEQALEADVYHVARAAVSREGMLSTTLRVAIDERAPFARWCTGEDDCYLIDETGFIFERLGASTTREFAEPFIFWGGVASTTEKLGAFVAPARFPSALAILRALGQAGYAPLRADIDSDTDFSILFESGFRLYVSFGAEPPTLVRNLKLIFASEPLKERLADLEYIDLRFGNRIFYKLRGEDVVGQ